MNSCEVGLWSAPLPRARAAEGAQLTQFTTLDLGGCDKITDTGLQHVALLTQLASLGLDECDKITDTGLKHVAQLTHLTSLDLGYCEKITDTGTGWSTLRSSRTSPA